ncbi:MAG: hypothetical protein R3C58_09950 [Parvularculaceae bacterium]
MKALPHLSGSYAETVCCAGIGHDAKWRRLYPVQFRILEDGQKFRRWQWISYEYTTSRKDARIESQKVVPESIETGGVLKSNERIRILNAIMRPSLDDASDKNESLALLRPKSINFSWIKKSDSRLENERAKHEVRARQLSLIDKVEAQPLIPSPYEFRVKWIDQDNTRHEHACDDWETSTAFFVRRRALGNDNAALESLRETYEIQYMRDGMALAFSTHSRRNITFGDRNQWLLVGMIRIDETKQQDLLSTL